MTFAERRLPEELVALYELEPTVREIIVEGFDDAALFDWYLDQRCETATRISVVDSIEVTSDFLKSYGLIGGNRDRVLALAYYLETELAGESRKCVTLVADADSSHFLYIDPDTELLLFTDYTCIEMYLFREAPIAKMLKLVLGGSDLLAADVLTALQAVLERLWLIKQSNQQLRFGMTWVPFLRSCTMSGAQIEFNEGSYVRKYLNSNGRATDITGFEKQVEELSKTPNVDRRNMIDGHHFIELARWYFRSHVRDRKPLSDSRSFERAFFGCLELGELDNSKLLSILRQRVEA